ncbi:MAG: nucleoside deaminase [Gemmatimonadales bacterium]|nr:nucleoside deaminase [Gemmatimonadales bacterium]
MTSDTLLADFQSHEHWLREALAEARLASEKGEVPVGAVMVREGRLIGRGHNQVEALGDPTAHAEVLAIGAAAGEGPDWRLDGSVLYVTLEPCTMCCGAILLARVSKVVFGVTDPRAGGAVSTARLFEGNPYRQKVEVVGGILAPECGALLKDFFLGRRD